MGVGVMDKQKVNNYSLFSKFFEIASMDSHEVKNISTFTSVYCSSITKRCLAHYLNKNTVDKRVYPSIVYLQKVIDRFLKTLYKHHSGKTIFTSGSTESILLALYFAREETKKKGIKKPNILLAESAHYSFFKCARLLNIETRIIKLKPDCSINLKEVEQKIDQNTILIIGTIGTTELGIIDDIKGLNRIAANNHIPLHIDAAIGGFILPFINAKVPYKFTQLDALFSINISGHKYGLSLPGCGLLLLREAELIKKYSDILSYLSSGGQRIESLLVTSNPLALVSLGVNILQYGTVGYKNITRHCLQTKKRLEQKLKQLGIEVFEGSAYIPQIFITHPKIETVSAYLKAQGWIQNPYVAKGIEKKGIRIVIKKGQEDLLTNKLCQDIKYALRKTQNSTFYTISKTNQIGT